MLYLGPNMPTDELAGAARSSGARAIGLSMVYPTDDPKTAGGLAQLRRLVGDDLPIFVGGRGAPAYNAAIDEARAVLLPTTAGFREELTRLRVPA